MTSWNPDPISKVWKVLIEIICWLDLKPAVVAAEVVAEVVAVVAVIVVRYVRVVRSFRQRYLVTRRIVGFCPLKTRLPDRGLLSFEDPLV